MTTDITTSQYASLGKRTLALCLDSLILAIPCALAGSILPVLGALVVCFFYAPIFESSRLQATLGKYCLRIHVTDLSGQRISLKAATIRNALKCLSSLFLFLGFFVALFSQKKQTLHDLLSDTLVVSGRIETPVADAWTAQIKETFGSSSTQESALSAATISEIERLQTLREKGALTEEEFLAQKRAILTRNGSVGTS